MQINVSGDEMAENEAAGDAPLSAGFQSSPSASGGNFGAVGAPL